MGTIGDTKMNKQELQQKCKNIFEEIMDLKEKLYPSDNQMLESVFVEYVEYEEQSDDKVLERKFKEQFKKVFQRVNKGQGGSKQTLKNLERFRSALYSTDIYKCSDFLDNSISPSNRRKLKKASDDLETALKLKHDIEK